MRRVAVPERSVDAKRVVARPVDGAPVVLPATAAVVWDELSSWTTVQDVVDVLASRYPQVPSDQRRRAIDAILAQLEDDGLLERR